MVIQLDSVEARILGSLVEKAVTTPDLYPLTFNSLLNACNQKSSRYPIMNLDVDTAGRGMTTLIEKGLAERKAIPGTRVPKFLHHIENLLGGGGPKEIATICVLLLRGPQTPGEIKTRTERLCTFTSSAEVEALLFDLSNRGEDSWVARLPRQPGQKEMRYQHLFSGGVPSAPESAPAPIPIKALAPDGHLAQLEKRVEALEAVVKNLEERLREPKQA